MEQETLFNILTEQYGEILETHAMWECISALGVKPFKDGNQWCFLYGDNIQEGICGFGDTIYKAAWDFYTNIKTESAEWGANHKPSLHKGLNDADLDAKLTGFMSRYVYENGGEYPSAIDIARHFYELGKNAK